MITVLELRSKRAARSTPVRRWARLERSALFYIPFFAENCLQEVIYKIIKIIKVPQKNP